MEIQEYSGKIDELYEHIIDTLGYKDILIKLADLQEYDLAIIIVWKTFIMFIYQRFNQVPNNMLCDIWDAKFNSDGKKLSNEVNMQNKYWANEIDDSKVITFLSVLYPLEKNIIKSIRNLLNERNKAAHVASTKTSMYTFDAFLDNTLGIINLIESEHMKKYSSYISDDSRQIPESQLPLVLDELLTNLKGSNTFRHSESIENKLVKILNGSLSNNDLMKILIEVVRNNQVYGASGTRNFLNSLYSLNKSEKIWTHFLDHINKKGISFPQIEERLMSDNLPF